LESILNQQIEDDLYEVIVIDDGSTDCSLDVIRRTVAHAPNVSVHTFPNGGVSAARNRGNQFVRGRYVWYVDPDDWIETGALKQIVDKTLLHPDVIFVNHSRSTGKGDVKVVTTGYDRYPRGFDQLKHRFVVPVHYYVVSRDLITTHQLAYYEGILHEDLEFTPRMLYFAQHIEYLEAPLYVYYKRPNSITTTPNPKRIFDLLLVSESLYRFFVSREKVVPRTIIDIVAIGVCHAFEYAAGSDSKSVRTQFLSCLPQYRPVMKMMLHAQQRSHLLRGVLFLYAPKCALALLRIYYKRRAAKQKRFYRMMRRI
jgi:glycosyltransferase involved in cell wall biosynthesis